MPKANKPTDGASCPGCGLANYEGLCPHCRGDQRAYEEELVPPFRSSVDEASVSEHEDAVKEKRE